MIIADFQSFHVFCSPKMTLIVNIMKVKAFSGCFLHILFLLSLHLKGTQSLYSQYYSYIDMGRSSLSKFHTQKHIFYGHNHIATVSARLIQYCILCCISPGSQSVAPFPPNYFHSPIAVVVIITIIPSWIHHAL